MTRWKLLKKAWLQSSFQGNSNSRYEAHGQELSWLKCMVDLLDSTFCRIDYSLYGSPLEGWTA